MIYYNKVGFQHESTYSEAHSLNNLERLAPTRLERFGNLMHGLNEASAIQAQIVLNEVPAPVLLSLRKLAGSYPLRKLITKVALWSS